LLFFWLKDVTNMLGLHGKLIQTSHPNYRRFKVWNHPPIGFLRFSKMRGVRVSRSTAATRSPTEELP
jgi:hypothetical protein